jgi:hypothetical protein
VYITLTVSNGPFPSIALVIEYSALIPLLLLRLARIAIVFCWDGEEIKEKVVLLRELDRAIIYNE